MLFFDNELVQAVGVVALVMGAIVFAMTQADE